MTKQQFITQVEECAAAEDAARLQSLAEQYLEAMLPTLSEEEGWHVDTLMRRTYRLAEAGRRSQIEAA